MTETVGQHTDTAGQRTETAGQRTEPAAQWTETAGQCPEPVGDASSGRRPVDVESVSAVLVAAEVIRPLRWRVLRPDQPFAEAVYPGDDAPDTFHVAVRSGGDVLACASFYREPAPDGREGWRLRGMASATPGRGYGSTALTFGLAEVQRRGGRLVWCNARLPAVPFYQRHGFTVTSAEFEIPPIGRHVVMERVLP